MSLSYLCTGAASMAIEHTQQHSPRLQTCGRTPAILYRSISWELITLKTHNR